MYTVVVVDDAMFMRKVLKDIINRTDEFKVVGEAGNGVEAVQKVRELNPDIVTLDITMPEVDGIKAAEEIKKINNRIQIIMVSAMGQAAMVKDAVKNGARDFIVKPFQDARVREALELCKNELLK